jgi:hypothetical protein
MDITSKIGFTGEKKFLPFCVMKPFQLFTFLTIQHSQF